MNYSGYGKRVRKLTLRKPPAVLVKCKFQDVYKDRLVYNAAPLRNVHIFEPLSLFNCRPRASVKPASSHYKNSHDETVVDLDLCLKLRRVGSHEGFGPGKCGNPVNYDIEYGEAYQHICLYVLCICNSRNLC